MPIYPHLFHSRHFDLGILKAVRDKVDWLVGGDGVGLSGGDRGIERLVLGLVAEAVLQLAEGGEEAGAVGLQFTALPANAELHREPVALEVVE